jgi:hypothetical protein
LPEVGALKFAELKAECKEIEAFALSLAEQVRDKGLADGKGKKQLGRKYPFLKPERLSQTWSQAIRYSLQ